LKVAEELESYQKELEEQKLLLQEADETAIQWDKVRQKCAEANTRGSRDMAKREAESCKLRAHHVREKIKHLDWEILLRTEIIVHFKEEGQGE
jgi:hypothetical protein